MAAGFVDIGVRFLADSSSVQKEAAKVEGTGGKIKSWAKGVGAALGAAFAVGQIKEWIGAASELQDQISASQQIFGAAAGTVEKFGGSAANAFGISKSEAIGAANTFATFGKSAGLSGENLAGFSTGLTGLAGDLASFRGTSPEQAIEAIGAALRGETEPIRSYGVLLDDATLRQRALSMGLISTTKTALTPQQKVLAAQAEILAQTTDAQGDFQRTGDSAANQQKKLAANIENTKAALGTALLPVLDVILPVLQTFAQFIQENAGWLVPLTAAVLGITAAVWLFNAALAANPIVLITIAIAALVAGLILAYQNVEWFGAIVDTVFAAIKVAVGAIVDAFQWFWNVVQIVFGWIVDHWQLLVAILTGPIGVAVMIIVRYWDTIYGAIKAVFDWVVGAFQTVSRWLIAPFEAAWNWIRQVPGWITDAFWNIVSWLAGTFQQVGDWITAPFKAAWDYISRYVVDPIKSAFSSIARLWNNTVGSLSFEIPGWVPGIGGKGFDVPDIPEMARGGIVTRATLAVIGERGPEAVVPLPRLAGAGTTINVQITTTGLGADSPAIQRAVVSALQNYVDRNGPLPGIAS